MREGGGDGQFKAGVGATDEDAREIRRDRRKGRRRWRRREGGGDRRRREKRSKENGRSRGNWRKKREFCIRVKGGRQRRCLRGDHFLQRRRRSTQIVFSAQNS